MKLRLISTFTILAAITGAQDSTNLKKLPAKPFDLSGMWISRGGVRVAIAQEKDELTTSTAPGVITFRGRYTSNPIISGETWGKGSTVSNPIWIPHTIEVKSPDQVIAGEEPLVRISPPENDIPCDYQNSNGVVGVYAWLRGEIALKENDRKRARCWLMVGTNQGYENAEIALAGLLSEDGTPAEKKQAFGMAAKYAEKGSMPAQSLLATMFREGKGTTPDPDKARFWQQRAEETARAAGMNTLRGNAGVILGFAGALGGIGSMVDLDPNMTQPNCFSHDALGNRNAPCK